MFSAHAGSIEGTKTNPINSIPLGSPLPLVFGDHHKHFQRLVLNSSKIISEWTPLVALWVLGNLLDRCKLQKRKGLRSTSINLFKGLQGEATFKRRFQMPQIQGQEMSPSNRGWSQKSAKCLKEDLR